MRRWRSGWRPSFPTIGRVRHARCSIVFAAFRIALLAAAQTPPAVERARCSGPAQQTKPPAKDTPLLTLNMVVPQRDRDAAFAYYRDEIAADRCPAPLVTKGQGLWRAGRQADEVLEARPAVARRREGRRAAARPDRQARRRRRPVINTCASTPTSSSSASARATSRRWSSISAGCSKNHAVIDRLR